MGNYFETSLDGFNWMVSLSNFKGNSREEKRSRRLVRMEELCRKFGHPERGFSIVHLAGSKGKGSTAVFIAAGLSRRGSRTGLFTSPHLSRYEERFQIFDGKSKRSRFPRENLLLTLMNEIREGLESLTLTGGEPTTFELLTLLGFLVFAREKCDWVVLETGMGGRLDATNVCRPDMTLITPIEKEHTAYLGDTLEAISREKGGIIKKGIPLLTARQHKDADRTLGEIARKKGAPHISLDDELEDYAVTYNREGTMEVDYRWKKGDYPPRMSLKMIGSTQAENAALALMALHALMPDFPRQELKEAFASALLPGRSQIISRSPLIILDGAHTPRSVEGIMEAFEVLAPRSKGRTLIFGCALDKDAASMAPLLAHRFDHIIISRPGTFKKSDTRSLEELFSKYGSCERIDDNRDALARARHYAGDEGALLVTGSFYLAGEIFDALE